MTAKHSTSGKTEKNNQRLSMAVENYLLSIFHLEEQGLRVTPSLLADQLKRLPESEGLGTSLPSVGGMLRRMVREKLVDLSRHKEVQLTSNGRKSAESIVRRHRLAERMVVDLLGLELHKAHVEAHRLEHAISPELERKIEIRLGHPTTCPFGHPIPGTDHKNASVSYPLSESSEKDTLMIERVPEEDQSLLEYFVENELVPGQRILVLEAARYRGVLRLKCGPVNEVVVDYEVASKIWVNPDNPHTPDR